MRERLFPSLVVTRRSSAPAAFPPSTRKNALFACRRRRCHPRGSPPALASGTTSAAVYKSRFLEILQSEASFGLDSVMILTEGDMELKKRSDVSMPQFRMAMLARTMRTVLGNGRLEDIGSTLRASSPDTKMIDYELHNCADYADFARVRNSATRIIDSVRRTG